jgi:hypothetical protein
MFKFGKDKDMDDPKKAIEKADKVLNKGLMGGITKAFMGKDFVDKANAGLNMANQALDGQAMAAQLAQTGADATAEVVHPGYRRDREHESDGRSGAEGKTGNRRGIPDRRAADGLSAGHSARG